MRKTIITIALIFVGIITASAEDTFKEIKLVVPEMKAELVYETSTPELNRNLSLTNIPETAPAPQGWMNTNPGVKPYKVMDDLTFVGIPVFVAGIIAKPEKKNFAQNKAGGKANTMLLTNFKTGIDDYTQYFGPAMTLGLKLSGVEGRSDWGRFLASAGMSYGIMAAFVNGIKYTAKEMRPDGSTRNSWPSGHTATSFVGATILHKEYGLTRSPWYSIAGYVVATATGVMRVLNNRHWVSDVLSGAGIGIMSTELAYALSDIIFKEKGLLRNDLEVMSDNPSFFAVSMGMSMGTKDFTFTDDDLRHREDFDLDDIESDPVNINFHTATTVDAEGAYFFNKYFGIGGRLRVRAMTAKNWNQFTEDVKEGNVGLSEMFGNVPSASDVAWKVLEEQQVIIESDHLTEFTGSVGFYFNLPLSKRFNLGTKALIGRSITQELDINSKVRGHQLDVDYKIVIENGNVTDSEINNVALSGKTYEEEWDILTMGGNNSTSFGTGLSLTYKYKSNFSWRVFVDYDYTKREYKLTYDPFRFLKFAMPNAVSFMEAYGSKMDPIEYVKKKKTHFFTIGASFSVSL